MHFEPAQKEQLIFHIHVKRKQVSAPCAQCECFLLPSITWIHTWSRNTMKLIPKFSSSENLMTCCSTDMCMTWRRSDDKFGGRCMWSISERWQGESCVHFINVPGDFTRWASCPRFIWMHLSDNHTVSRRKHILYREWFHTHSSDNHTVTVPDFKWPALWWGGEWGVGLLRKYRWHSFIVTAYYLAKMAR